MPTFRDDNHRGTKVPLVKTDDLDELSVTEAKLADGSVTTPKIVDKAVTPEKLSTAVLQMIDSGNSRKLGANDIADNAITTPKLADGSVTTPKLAGNAVTTEKIADESITTDKIGAGQVTSDRIAKGSIDSAHIQDGAVGESKIAASAVTTEKIADGSIEKEKLAADAVTEEKIAAGAVSTDEIQDGAVTLRKLGSDIVFPDTEALEKKIESAKTEALEAAKDAKEHPILPNVRVSEDNIMYQAVTKNKLADGSVTKEKLAANSVTEEKIAEGAVSTDEIQDGSVTIRKLSPDLIRTLVNLVKEIANGKTVIFLTKADITQQASAEGLYAMSGGRLYTSDEDLSWHETNAESERIYIDETTAQSYVSQQGMLVRLDKEDSDVGYDVIG